MLLVKFDLKDLEKCETVADVYRAMGVGVKEGDPQDLNFYNKKVFGKKAYYANMFINPETASKVKDILGKEKVLDWFNFAPVCDGDRFTEVENEIGEINESVLYIVTPEDKFYIEDPSTKDKE